jgi:hypothetical protein
VQLWRHICIHRRTDIGRILCRLVNEFAVLQVFGHAEVSDARCVELGCEVRVAVRVQAKEAAGSKSKQDAHCMAKARCALHASGMLIALSRLGAYSLATLTTLGWSLLMLLIGDYSDRTWRAVNGPGR